MRCPRCERVVLDERERNGVTVDVCSQCRGVWLDRGELEKLLAYANRELEDERSYYNQRLQDRDPPSSDRKHGHGHDPRRGPYRKKSWLENLGDIFD